MSELDWVIIAILAVSTLLGLFRGMIRELFALGGWIAAFVFSIWYAGDLSEKIPLKSAGPLGRYFIAILIIVIASVFAAGLIGNIIRKILSLASVGAQDKGLGGFFGLLRGAVIVMVLLYLGSLSDNITTQQWWKSSELVPYVFDAIDVCKPYLPDEIQKYIK
ncbi:MAG: CvpA family protein [Burkholderiales bacterium]|nr:CvpA family protein [Burkholderiales bacterium]